MFGADSASVYFYQLGSVLANFMLVSLAISYIGTESYGVWLTISLVIAWFALFDIGLGNGLRNKFAEANALGNDQSAQAFVSTAYFTIPGGLREVWVLYQQIPVEPAFLMGTGPQGVGLI